MKRRACRTRRVPPALAASSSVSTSRSEDDRWSDLMEEEAVVTEVETGEG